MVLVQEFRDTRVSINESIVKEPKKRPNKKGDGCMII